jgi:DNA-directed RNA polymerase subunit RPC12/RpoP
VKITTTKNNPIFSSGIIADTEPILLYNFIACEYCGSLYRFQDYVRCPSCSAPRTLKAKKIDFSDKPELSVQYHLG